MVDTKLQELIETLKRQGVESGEEASRRIIEDANTQAREIVSSAESEAKAIIARANEQAEKLRKQLRSSLETAASQFLTSLKRTIEENFLTLPLKKKVGEDLTDTTFLKELMTICVREYMKNSGHADLTVLVSKEQQQKLSGFALELMEKPYSHKTGERLTLRLEGEGSAFGFMLGKSQGNVTLDFTDQAFLELFLRYLSPRFHDFFNSIDVKELSNG